MPWPAAWTWTLPGFSAASSSAQAARYAAAMLRGAGTRPPPRWMTVAARSHVGHVLQAAPARHGVHLQQPRRAVAVAQDVAPAIAAPTHAAARTARARHLRRRGEPFGPATAAQVGDPALRAPRHGRDHVARDHQQAVVAETAWCRRHEALQVIDAAHVLWRRQRIGHVDQHQPAPLRAEQRLAHERAGAGLARDDGLRAAARPSTVQLGGVGSPARASRKLVVDLSTQRSMARASFSTGTPSSRSACRRPSRRVTSSKLPPPMARTSTASGRSSAKPGSARPEGVRSVEAAGGEAQRGQRHAGCHGGGR